MTPEDFVKETLEDRSVSTFVEEGRCLEGGADAPSEEFISKGRQTPSANL